MCSAGQNVGLRFAYITSNRHSELSDYEASCQPLGSTAFSISIISCSFAGLALVYLRSGSSETIGDPPSVDSNVYARRQCRIYDQNSVVRHWSFAMRWFTAAAFIAAVL